jgi:hypothetical protein
MPPRLAPRHFELLRDLARSVDPVPASRIDGRMLRPLKSQALVTERNGLLVVTSAARTLVGGPALNEPGSAPPRLNEAQADLLRHLCRQAGPVPADHADGRIVRALVARGLVREEEGWVTPTPEGAEHYETHVRRRRRAGTDAGTRSARAESILRALEAIELAIPRDAEVRVGGDTIAYADDVITGLREFARQLVTKSSASDR